MERIKINVYNKLENEEETQEIYAIKEDDVIKYIDLENNKMIIDMKNNVITRENEDYLFTLDFNSNAINILIKKIKKEFIKSIKTILIDKNKKSYLVRYLLIDEKEINEYYVKF